MQSTTGILSFAGLLGIIGGSFVSIWAFLKFVIFGSYRLNSDTSKRLIDRISKNEKWAWVLNGEHVVEPKYPDTYEALVVLSGIIFFFSRQERMMTAGHTGKEDVSSVVFFRWNRKKINTLLHNESDSAFVTISALAPFGQDRLGTLEIDKEAKTFLNSGTYEDIEEEVVKVVAGKTSKTGCLLFGPPGNGKTQFVKYLAKKYSLPIFIIYLDPDYRNFDIAKMFSEIPRRCIVLLEDFDNYFDGRECIMKNESVKFTFDSIINALDGVHNDYRGVVFMMTVNDLSKIDDSLKKRPSRFKFVREFGLPDEDLRSKILEDDKLVAETAGFSLDQVFAKKAQQNNASSVA
jgi:hypothetical protein